MANALERDLTLEREVVRSPGVRIASERYGAGVYEAVVTTLASGARAADASDVISRGSRRRSPHAAPAAAPTSPMTLDLVGVAHSPSQPLDELRSEML